MRRFPSEDVLLKMADVLHVDVADLKKLDSRPPVQELRRRAEADPAYGIALRRMVERDVKPEDILKMLERKSKEEPK